MKRQRSLAASNLKVRVKEDFMTEEKKEARLLGRLLARPRSMARVGPRSAGIDMP